jgi:hypothetical protein
MIPKGDRVPNITVQEEQQPSLTYKLDFEKGRASGRIDGLEAVRQAVFKAIQTDRFWHEIYTFDYGHELGSLIGGNVLYVQSEVSRMISEALLQDDRINSIENTTVNVVGDGLAVRFTVVSDFGSFEEEVTRNV